MHLLHCIQYMLPLDYQLIILQFDLFELNHMYINCKIENLTGKVHIMYVQLDKYYIWNNMTFRIVHPIWWWKNWCGILSLSEIHLWIICAITHSFPLSDFRLILGYASIFSLPDKIDNSKCHIISHVIFIQLKIHNMYSSGDIYFLMDIM